MGSESAPDEQAVPRRAVLQDRLGTEAVTFVDTLGAEIATVVEDAPALTFDYVVGEVSDHGVSSNGHVHFDLTHGDATIHCVCFASRRSTVDADLDDGQQVAVTGDLSYYEANGSLSVIVADVVTVGTGQYQQTYERNRAILAADGLLDPETKRALPTSPDRIGLVTSAESDARTDAVTSLRNRHRGVDIVVHDTPVQGDDAMAALMGAVSELDDAARVDVIVVTRGGGADVDLRVFNETPLCRVLHNTSTPVVVAVGHDADRTLAGAVADERVMTPTDVGRIVPDVTALAEECETLRHRLDTAYAGVVEDRLGTLAGRLDRAYRDHTATRLMTLRTDLDHAYDTRVTQHLTALDERLATAWTGFERQRAHRQQTDRYRRQRRRLVAALVVLGLVVVILALVLILS
ncbi:exodeoxyribonuclease VII large subunit [Haloplanus natans]|uniref:exodeoxyribonuclease VII large subunit n=1 Tax=Haloplanus natans TaxID=376171 RepID=UPI0006781A2B|nr:exodeoxyribonuclease VII large subunit [Haloplanus natans]